MKLLHQIWSLRLALTLMAVMVSYRVDAQIVQTYYVGIPETDILTSYQTIRPSGTCGGGSYSADPISTYVSFVVSRSGGVIYFDHWEDGYETTTTSPVQSTTTIWGDGNTANGAAPGYPTDILPRGAVVVLSNDVVTSTRQAVVDYDGADKISATVPITLTRLGWATNTGTPMADAAEELATLSWGSAFTVPVGENTSGTSSFNYTGASIMAASAGTVDSIDTNGDGTTDVTTTLGEGQSYLQNGGLQQGARITATAPIQLFLLTGRRCSQYESRWYLLTPDSQLSTSYYSPVSTQVSAPARVLLHNPGTSAITVKWKTDAGLQTDISLNAHETKSQTVPFGSGARFYTLTSDTFVALGAIDDDTTNDWGFTLISSRQLRQQAQVGLGLGKDPTQSGSENGGPVWLTVDYPDGSASSGSIDVCVDYDGDRVGSLTDSNGIAYDQLVTLDPLDRAIVYDSDGDQTGMMLWVCDGSDGRLATAWGQDPATASTGAPAIDAGTTVPGFPLAVAAKSSTLTGDTNGNGWLDLGETITYAITISQSGNLPVPAAALTVKDTLPAQVTYVAGTTTYQSGSGAQVAIPDDGSGTPFPLDGSGYVTQTIIPIDGTLTIRFQVTVSTLPSGSSPILNTATIDGAEAQATNSTYVPASIRGTVFLDSNQSGTASTGEGVSGVVLDAIDTGGNVVATATTNSQGLYTFCTLLPGTYRVVIRSSNLTGAGALSGRVFTVDPDGGTAHEVSNAVVQDQDVTGLDFGYEPVGDIGGTVFNDSDASGTVGSGEGVAGVMVKLLDGSGTVVSTTTTSSAGAYQFASRRGGNYTVVVDNSSFGTGEPLSGFSETTDPDTTFDNQNAFALTAGNSKSGVDFGYRSTSALGNVSGVVFVDSDRSGTAGGSEGRSGVTVSLVRGDGTVYRTTTTASDGSYSFVGVAPGSWEVRVDNSTLSGHDNSVDPDSGTPHRATVTVAAGLSTSGISFGYVITPTPTPTPTATPTSTPTAASTNTPVPGATPVPTAVPTSTPTDGDNDGVPDVNEGETDTDGDRIVDRLDLDSDNDGIPDSIEGNGDQDNDGIPNRLDLDADSDGVPDVVEGGNPDANGDSLVDDPTDADGNGWADDAEQSPRRGAPVRGTQDADADGTPDYLDVDSDGNGTPDGRQRCSTRSLRTERRAALQAINVLVTRIQKFDADIVRCGQRGTFRGKGSSMASGLRSRLNRYYSSEVLSCPVGICSAVTRSGERSSLVSRGQALGELQRKAKLNAISACRVSTKPHKGPRKKDSVGYTRDLTAALGDLPSRYSQCGG